MNEQADCPLLAQVGALFRGPMGRWSLLVHGLGIVSTGLAAWATFLMIDGAAPTGEVLAWTAAAWLAWSVVIGLKLWIWSRLNHVSILREG